jgi:hypothetical protein
MDEDGATSPFDASGGGGREEEVEQKDLKVRKHEDGSAPLTPTPSAFLIFSIFQSTLSGGLDDLRVSTIASEESRY